MNDSTIANLASMTMGKSLADRLGPEKTKEIMNQVYVGREHRPVTIQDQVRALALAIGDLVVEVQTLKAIIIRSQTP